MPVLEVVRTARKDRRDIEHIGDIPHIYPKARQQMYRIAKRAVAKQTELKYIGTNVTTNQSVSDATPVFQPFNYPVQGDTDFNRDGDQIMLKRLRIRIQMYRPQTVPGNAAYIPNSMRFLVIQWKDNRTPAITDILQSNAYLSFIRWDQRQLFKVLMDKHVHFSTNGNAEVLVKRTLYKMRQKVQFVSGTQTCTNKLYYLILSDNGVTDQNKCTYNFNARVEFTDV